MHKGIIASLILAVLLVVFTLQNTDQVQIDLWFWSIHTSLALLVIVLLVAGALMAYLLFLPTLFNKNKTIRDLKAKAKQSQNVNESPEAESDKIQK